MEILVRLQGGSGKVKMGRPTITTQPNQSTLVPPRARFQTYLSQCSTRHPMANPHDHATRQHSTPLPNHRCLHPIDRTLHGQMTLIRSTMRSRTTLLVERQPLPLHRCLRFFRLSPRKSPWDAERKMSNRPNSIRANDRPLYLPLLRPLDEDPEIGSRGNTVRDLTDYRRTSWRIVMGSWTMSG